MAMLTVEIDDELLVEVKKRLAGSKAVTESALVRDALLKFVGRNLKTPYDHLNAFSAGAISRQQAQEALGLSYGELLQMMSRFELELPRVDPGRAETDAEMLLLLMQNSS